jgi:type IV secretory pathway TraG/TraD family ATPase VirD4
MNGFNDLKKTLVKLYGIWVLADFIMWGLSLLYVWLTGNLVDVLSALFISLTFGLIPFPFNILALWQIDPLSIILQTVVFFAILGFLMFRNRGND